MSGLLLLGLHGGETDLKNEPCKRMVNLARLLWLDDECLRNEALSECFGDRYVCANNSLFSRVRSLFFSCGCSFSLAATRLWRDYASFSLLMLQEMLDAGIVPYKDNAVTIRRIVERAPWLELPANSLLTLLERNHLMHESAHCVAYRTLCPHFKVSGPATSKDQYALVMILCEDYANTVERLGAGLATTEAHRLLYGLNSYVECRPNVCGLLKDALRIFGLRDIFRLGMLSFHYLNTHETGLDEEVLDRMIDAILLPHSVTDAKRVLLKIVVNHGFGLSKQFRTQTTPLFFNFVGCEKEYQSLCKRPFHMHGLSEVGVFDAISILTEITCDGVGVDLPAEAIADHEPMAQNAG